MAFSHPADSDFVGSVAMMITGTHVHFRRWNERVSQPSDQGMVRASISLDVHFRRGGF